MEKIDSQEKYHAWVEQFSASERYNAKQNLLASSWGHNAVSRAGQSELPYWVKRELLRMRKVYTSSGVLEWVNTLAPVFAHVSLKEPSKVAFTPDQTAGLQDRQVITTIGRLLLRVVPFLTEEAVRKLTAEHEADLCTDLYFAEGEEITKMYMEMPDDIGACMSKTLTAGNWKVHPTLAYHAPGIKLAYLKTPSGKVTARSLVYEASETDKRYIRAYGKAATLSRVLEQNGYKLGNWVGAKLNAVIVDHYSDTSVKVVLPYLDANGARGSNYDCSVALIDGQLTVISTEVQNAIRAEFNSAVASGVTTNGYVSLLPISSDRFSRTCCFTGITLSTLESHVEWEQVLLDGERKWALAAAVPPYFVTARASGGKPALANPEDCQQSVSNVYYYQTAAQMSENGYCQLDATLYPENAGRWIDKYQIVALEDGRIVMDRDAIQIVDNSSGTVNLKWVLLKELNPKQYVKLHGGHYATKTSKWEVTTSGRKVIDGFSDFYRMYSGDIQLRKPPLSEVWCGQTYYYGSEAERRNAAEDARHQAAFASVFNTAVESGYYEPVIKYRTHYYSTYNGAYHGAVRSINKISDKLQVLAGLFEGAYKRVILSRLAEMEAVEYPNYLLQVNPVSVALPAPEFSVTPELETI